MVVSRGQTFPAVGSSEPLKIARAHDYDGKWSVGRCTCSGFAAGAREWSYSGSRCLHTGRHPLAPINGAATGARYHLYMQTHMHTFQTRWQPPLPLLIRMCVLLRVIVRARKATLCRVPKTRAQNWMCSCGAIFQFPAHWSTPPQRLWCFDPGGMIYLYLVDYCGEASPKRTKVEESFFCSLTEKSFNDRAHDTKMSRILFISIYFMSQTSAETFPCLCVNAYLFTAVICRGRVYKKFVR